MGSIKFGDHTYWQFPAVWAKEVDAFIEGDEINDLPNTKKIIVIYHD